MSLRLFNSEPFFSLRQFNRIFDDALRGRATPALWAMNGPEHTTFMPRLDVKESPEGTMTASFELPGMTKDDVNIELHGDRLMISGETKSSSERTENENYVVRERRFGKFSQSLPVPEGTEPEAIRASVADGILTVSFPKATPSVPEPKKITVS